MWLLNSDHKILSAFHKSVYSYIWLVLFEDVSGENVSADRFTRWDHRTNTSFAQLPAAGSLLFYIILQDTLQSSQLHPPDNAMLITLSLVSLKYIYKLTNITFCTDLKLYISRHSTWLLLKHLLKSTNNTAWCYSAADCETKSCDI